MALNRSAAVRNLATQVARQPRVSADLSGTTNHGGSWFTAQYVTAESGANLSEISINGKNYRNVPKLINAWSSTPSAGTNLLVLQFTGAFMIIGVITGQPELATVGIGAGG